MLFFQDTISSRFRRAGFWFPACLGLCALGVLVLPGSAFAQTRPASESSRSLADELPRVDPVPPEQALSTFEIVQGFHLELVASEPDVSDPVDACFDADGRMYVAEMHGYPFSSLLPKDDPLGGGRPNVGVIRLLEDTDGDGRYDRSVRFADGISWPTSVCCYQGGVFALASPDLYYFKDTDGDGVADVRRIVFSGFSRQNVQGLANNMKWGLDNRIYAAGGRNGGAIMHDGQVALEMRGNDIRFDPSNDRLERVTGGVQFGHSMDDWGNRFVCSNSSHIQHVLFPDEYLVRNPNFSVPETIRSIAKEGPAAPVFRRSPPEPWRVVRTRWRLADPGFRQRLSRTEQFAAGFFTSASGVTIYRGDVYPEAFRGNAFVGDVGGNLVHRKRLDPQGASFAAIRADEQAEFIASTDNWFRPVNFVNAPDGTLYILDMYRETIEHPASIPEEIKAHVDLESGHDRGRIYRIVSDGFSHTPPPRLSQATAAELVSQLESGNAWNRETAQRLLWERQDRSAVGPLAAMVEQSSKPLARVHALWTLDGLQSLTPNVLVRALSDRDGRVKEHAVRLSEKHVPWPVELAEKLSSLADDPDPRVRFQLALSLGESSAPDAASALARLATHSAGDPDIRSAVLTSAAGLGDTLAIELLRQTHDPQDQGLDALLVELARMAAARPDSQSPLALLTAAFEPTCDTHLSRAVVRGIAEGLSRRGIPLARLVEPLPVDAPARVGLEATFRDAVESTGDAEQPLAARIAAVELLAYSDFATANARLPNLLEPQEPQQLQLAAVRALTEHGDDSVGRLFVDRWPGLTPPVRRDVVDRMLQTLPRIEQLLSAVEANRIRSSELERDKKQLLMTHPDSEVRERSGKLFGDELNTDRARVVAAYQEALDRERDPGRGRKVFEKQCAACHRVGNVGHAVGPDLVSAQNKSPADLLVSILDPNREAQPNFTTYSVFTEQGRIYNGMIAQETATSLTLRRAEGKEDVIPRSSIGELISSGKSLMPEGLEKEISLQDMADLLAFVKAIAPQSR